MTTEWEPERLAEMLLNGSDGDNAQSGAVGLLIQHDYWITRIGLHHPEVVAADGEYARLKWAEIAEKAPKEWASSSSELQILLLACSLGSAQVRVSLRDALVGLDETNLQHFLWAAATTGGKRRLASMLFRAN